MVEFESHLPGARDGPSFPTGNQRGATSEKADSFTFPGGDPYSLAATNAVTSASRLEYPHSLSYQEKIFTSLPPKTLVSGASKIDDAGLPLKSTDTSGASLYARMPLSGPSAAFFIAALTAFSSASFSGVAVKSTTETF